MFMGSEGGILGVGTPEVFTILLVGYFVLGPSDLYKLVKEIGKFAQNIRTLGSQASESLETNLESQLQLEEIRKAQRELNDAFSFRRSINNFDDEEDSDMFSSDISPEATAAAPAPIKDPTKKKRRIRVRKRKKPKEEPVVVPEAVEEKEDEEEDDDDEDEEENWYDDDDDDEDEDDEDDDEDDEEDEEEDIVNNIPDLDMTSSFDAKTLREQRMERLKSGQPFAPTNGDAASNRFAQQLSGDWNESILANEDKLGPLAKVMEKIALLEDEKRAADARIEEEFRLRRELEEKFYEDRRKILEQASAEIQAEAYSSSSDPSSTSSEKKDTK